MSNQDKQKSQPKGKGKPLDIPIPTRGEFDSFVRKVAGRPAGRKRPAEKDPPPERSE
jgi:hypothetical protein